MDSEQTWAQRFDRVASENAALLVALHTRSDELRKLALDRIGKDLLKLLSIEIKPFLVNTNYTIVERDHWWFKVYNIIWHECLYIVIALVRERDELVAALEIKNRIQGESSPVHDGPYSSEEVIIEVYPWLLW